MKGREGGRERKSERERKREGGGGEPEMEGGGNVCHGGRLEGLMTGKEGRETGILVSKMCTSEGMGIRLNINKIIIVFYGDSFKIIKQTRKNRGKPSH